VTASASNGRWVSTWKSTSAGHSQKLHILEAVQMGIMLVTMVRRLWGCQPYIRKGSAVNKGTQREPIHGLNATSLTL